MRSKLAPLLLAGAFLMTPALPATAAKAAAAPAPATQESGQRPPAASNRGGMPLVAAMLERVRSAMSDIELTPEQKTRIDAIVKKAETDLAAMKGELESMDFRERATQVRQFFESVRTDIAQVLTEEQREQVQKKMDQVRDRVRPPGGPGARRPDGPPSRDERGAAAGPTSAPAGEPRRGEGRSGAAGGNMPPGEAMIERLRESLAKLDLSDDQKTQLRGLFEELREKGEALRADIANAGPDVRQKFRALGQETREKVTQILTNEQRMKLQEMMAVPGGEPGERPGRGGPPNVQRGPRGATGEKKGDKPAGDDQMMMQDNMTEMAGAAGDGKKPAGKAAGDDAQAAKQPTPAGPSVGDAAPELALTKLDGSKLTLSSLKGRVVVVVFGSYSNPSFRNRAAAIEKLKTEYGPRATFVIVYAAEAHPAGEWDVARNKEEGISVEQPKTAEARKALAQTAREKLKLTTPIALDSTANDAATAYGAGANSAYVIDRDGRIAARQQWFEPMALKRALDQATKSATGAAAGTGT